MVEEDEYYQRYWFNMIWGVRMKLIGLTGVWTVGETWKWTGSWALIRTGDLTWIWAVGLTWIWTVVNHQSDGNEDGM